MHGLNFLPSEDPQDYVKLKSRLFAEFKPFGRSQEKLMKSVAKAIWKLQRVQRLGLHRELVSDMAKHPAAGPGKLSQK